MTPEQKKRYEELRIKAEATASIVDVPGRAAWMRHLGFRAIEDESEQIKEMRG